MSVSIVIPARDTKGRFAMAIAISVIAIAALALLNTVRGAPNVSPLEVWRTVVGPTSDVTNQAQFLIRELRIPRVLLGICCGAALGITGVLLQDTLRNPLADPGLLGIAEGASFTMALTVLFPGVLPPLPRPFICLIAGIIVGVAVVAFSGTIRNPVRMILAGSIFSAFFATLTTIVLLLAPYQRTGGISAYFRYVTGSVSAAEWSTLRMVLPWLAVGIPAAFLSSRMLNLLQLGDDLAAGAGLNPFRARLGLTVLAMVLVAPVIAAIGPVSFIALFAPHIARGLLKSSDAQRVLMVSGLCGAALLLAADTVGRLLFFPTEIPAGIWTVAMVGPAAIVSVGRIAQRTMR